MANSDPHILESSIRRIRSTGDIPRRPEPALIQSNTRPSESGLDYRDHHISTPTPMQGSSCNPSSSRTDGTPSSAPAVPISDSSSSWPTNGLSITSGTPTFPQGRAAQGVQTTNHTDAPPNQPPASARSTSLIGRLMTYFGLGRRASHARKALVSLIWGICWDVTQIVVIITMLILTGVHFRSTKDPNLSEWKACDRPLGIWACIWIIRVVLAAILGYWDYRRNRLLNLTRSDPETSSNREQTPAPHNAQGHGGPPPLDNGTSPPGPAQEPPAPPQSVLYSRLTLLSSLLTLSWFLTAHILEYTSINTCRHTSPHLWWLVFAILCTMYIMVLEVVLLGFVVLVVAPILFIFWNVFLICIGRHPLQNPNMIKPEIGKLPKAVVERIPLVMYIPPPPEKEKDVITQPPHVYPPKVTASNNLPERRFKLLRNFTSFRSKKIQGDGTNVNEKLAETLGNTEIPSSWEDSWEQSEYPFVALEGNRAACAICLMDFEEPKRRNPVTDINSLEPSQEQEGTTDLDAQIGPGSAAPLSQGSNITEEHRQDQLKLEDAGDGAQPLRLLECGHVFHKTCLDPWLTDVSGRCPVCQRPVEAPKQRKKSRRTS